MIHGRPSQADTCGMKTGRGMGGGRLCLGGWPGRGSGARGSYASLPAALGIALKGSCREYTLPSGSLQRRHS